MEEIGRRLRAAREAKNISLEVAEEETRIRRRYIEALEAGRQVDLPGDAYTKGFLRTYGNYLGLDGPALVEEYKRSREPVSGAAREPVLAPAPKERPSVPAQAPAPEPRRAERRPRRRPAQPEGGGPGNFATTLVVVAMIAAVAGVGWLIFGRGGGQPKGKEPEQTKPPVTTTQPEQTPSQTATTPPPKQPDPPKVTMSRPNGEDVIFAVPAADLDVIIDTDGQRAWSNVTIDGRTQDNVYITGTQEFKGKDIRIRIGFMKGVSLTVNGQQFDKPLPGGPYNLIFKAQ